MPCPQVKRTIYAYDLIKVTRMVYAYDIPSTFIPSYQAGSPSFASAFSDTATAGCPGVRTYRRQDVPTSVRPDVGRPDVPTSLRPCVLASLRPDVGRPDARTPGRPDVGRPDVQTSAADVQSPDVGMS